MGHLLKFAGMILMSAFAFSGISLLKTTLNTTIPEGSPMAQLIRTMPHIILREKFWLAILCYACAMAVYLFLLQTDQASKVFTTTVAVNILLTTGFSAFFLGDTLNGVRLLGVLLVILGIFLINGSLTWK